MAILITSSPELMTLKTLNPILTAKSTNTSLQPQCSILMNYPSKLAKPITMFLITYLLMALIVVAKISMSSKGALRAH